MLKTEFIVTQKSSKEAEKLTLKKKQSNLDGFKNRKSYSKSGIQHLQDYNCEKPSLSLIKKISFPGNKLSTPLIEYLIFVFKLDDVYLKFIIVFI